MPNYAGDMPEGDALHRAAQRLQVLAGQHVEVETPHPRAAAKGLADVLDGRRLDSVEAVGKNLLLHFEGGLVLRSHLRMTGRWRVAQRGAPRTGLPWLVIRGREHVMILERGVNLVWFDRNARPSAPIYAASLYAPGERYRISSVSPSLASAGPPEGGPHR